MKFTSALLVCILIAPLLLAKEYLVYVGTYTRGKSKGIYVYRMDSATGKLKDLGLAAESDNPSFLAIHPNHQFLYAVNEGRTGTVEAFSIDAATGKLTKLNSQPVKGSGPCHLAVDKTGRLLLVANYGSGSVNTFRIKPDGSLNPISGFMQHAGTGGDKSRQTGPHAHGTYISSNNRFVIVPDLGIDRVMVHRFDPATGALEANKPPFAVIDPASGPRHFAFHPKGKFAYVINELSSTVTAFTYDGQHGALAPIQTISTLPAGFKGNSSTAEVFVDKAGKYLYGSNRGHDSITQFAIDKKTGKLTWVDNVSTKGKTPRSFALDPTGKFAFAANQDTDNITGYQIDRATGKLTPGDNWEVGAPVCIVFLPVK